MGELTPCTTAATPACRARGGPGGAGPGRLQEAGETAPGRTRDSLGTSDNHHILSRRTPACRAASGASHVSQEQTPAPGHGGISLAGDVFLIVSPEPVLSPAATDQHTQIRLEEAGAHPETPHPPPPHDHSRPSANGAAQPAPAHLLPRPGGIRKHRHTHVPGLVRPPTHHPQGPFPRSALVNLHSDWAKAASRCAAVPTPPCPALPEARPIRWLNGLCMSFVLRKGRAHFRSGSALRKSREAGLCGWEMGWGRERECL